MKEMKLKIRGKAPLLMQSGRLANPLDPLSRKIKQITKLKQKTDEDLEEILRLKFMGSLYYEEKIGFHIPSMNLERALFDAAKEYKLGKRFSIACVIVEDALPLIYEGPRDPEKLYKDLNFVDVRCVVVGRSRVPMARPIFKVWGLEATLAYNEDLIDTRDVQQVAQAAGRQGLGTFRRRFGKWELEGR